MSVAALGGRFWKQPLLWLFAALILVPSFLWYYHAHLLYLEYHNTFGILSGGYDKFARADLLLSPGFYERIAGRTSVYVLTPLVFLLMVYGCFAPRRVPERRVFIAWLLGLALYCIVVAEGNYDMIHYQLPVLAPGAALAGLGLMTLAERMEDVLRQSGSSRRASRVVMIGFAALMVSVVAAAYLGVSRGALAMDRDTRRMGRNVGTVTERGSLLIVAGYYGSGKAPDAIDTPPEVFYFSDRKGWYLAMSHLTAEAVEKMKNDGARYFVTCGKDAAQFRASHPVLPYLAQHYIPVLDDGECLVFDLKTREHRP
jgi:hypothetical protein